MDESSAPAPADADADAASVTLPEVYEDAPEDWRLSMAVEAGPRSLGTPSADGDDARASPASPRVDGGSPKYGA